MDDLTPEKFVSIARTAKTVRAIMDETGLSRGAVWNRITRYRSAGVLGLDHFRGPHNKLDVDKLNESVKEDSQ